MATADASEGIAAKNAGLQQQQQQDASNQLGGLYKTDTSGMLQSQGQEANDIKVGQTGGIVGDIGTTLGDIGGIAKLAGGFGIPGFGGFAPKNAGGQ
jgi:hypothetical protein